MKKGNQCNYSCKKKTNVTQTSPFPCPTEPVPGVQIVGMVQRDVSEKKGGGGASKGTRSLLIFFPALLLHATLHHPNACNRLCPRKEIGDADAYMRMRANGGAGH